MQLTFCPPERNCHPEHNCHPERSEGSPVANRTLPPILCLMGPTASGKTELAVEIVKRLPCEIISVDSAMVYRGMDIGTAKPRADLLKIAPHRLINLLDPKESYSAGQFRNDALREIKQITQQGKIPLLVGGTMLYFRILQQGIVSIPKPDPALRAQIKEQSLQLGLEHMHALLAKLDPLAASRIKERDGQRISRALEVFYLTGKSICTWQAESTLPLADYCIHSLALAPMQRNVLHERIAKRFDAMLDLGFITEVKRLFERGDLTPDLPALRAVGYRETWNYLSGQLDFTAMREKSIIATRQLAKRQMTWLRSFANTLWLESTAQDRVTKALKWVESVI